MFVAIFKRACFYYQPDIMVLHCQTSIVYGLLQLQLPQYEYNILVIIQVQGKAKDVGDN